MRPRYMQAWLGLSRRMRDGSLPRQASLFALKILNFGCLLHLFAEHVGSIQNAEGPSMLPTLGVTGEWVVESRLFDRQKVQRGDLITFTSPLDPTRVACKRVIGLPGDVVCVDPTGEYAPSTEHVVVPKNHVWISGDNLAFSRDSRTYGPVSMALIKGKLVARIFPIRDATILRNTFEYID